ncbi:hypothetical protein [Kitasatospora albolonga]|uniref:hypothetical protein n=1 Tax=Kitasatospora albolonga TaxID=68173 RepID=UPI0031EEA9E8
MTGVLSVRVSCGSRAVTGWSWRRVGSEWLRWRVGSCAWTCSRGVMTGESERAATDSWRGTAACIWVGSADTERWAVESRERVVAVAACSVGVCWPTSVRENVGDEGSLRERLEPNGVSPFTRDSPGLLLGRPSVVPCVPVPEVEPPPPPLLPLPSPDGPW